VIVVAHDMGGPRSRPSCSRATSKGGSASRSEGRSCSTAG
jgi:hypothetical protein